MHPTRVAGMKLNCAGGEEEQGAASMSIVATRDGCTLPVTTTSTAYGACCMAINYFFDGIIQRRLLINNIFDQPRLGSAAIRTLSIFSKTLF